MFRSSYVNSVKSKQTKFNVGSRVSWTSHSPKGTATKVGTIIAVIEPGENVNMTFKDGHKYIMPGSMGSPRALRSYLIAVKLPPKSKFRKGVRKDRLYFPFPNALKAI